VRFGATKSFVDTWSGNFFENHGKDLHVSMMAIWVYVENLGLYAVSRRHMAPLV
jgi:hypothetical protein